LSKISGGLIGDKTVSRDVLGVYFLRVLWQNLGLLHLSRKVDGSGTFCKFWGISFLQMLPTWSRIN